MIIQDRMTPTEVAKELGVQTETLAVWRATKRYPLAFYKLGRNVFYKREDVEIFIESRRRNPTPPTAA